MAFTGRKYEIDLPSGWVLCLMAACGMLVVGCSSKEWQESAPGKQASGNLMSIAGGMKQGKNVMFQKYDSSKSIKWSSGAISQLDFTGVAFDMNRTATLISPIHVLMAAHHSRQVGEMVVFHDRTGKRHEAKLVELKYGPPDSDLAVARLDRAMPISPYKVLPGGLDNHQMLRLEPVVVTNQYGQVFIHTIHHIANGYMTLGPLADLNSGLAGKLVSGDSGNPSFLYQDGTMILVELHRYGGFGRGPFISDKGNFASINALMQELGGGHQLSVQPYRRTGPTLLE